jgi:hypothetical protein
MTGEHPTPGELLDLHFGEARGRQGSRTAAHVAACPRCREEIASVEWVERSLAALPEEAPPADGLERVMSHVGGEGRARGRGPGWLGPMAAGVAGLGGSAAVIYGLGAWLLALPPFAQWCVLEPARIASGFGLAALAFFAVGSFVTLALAPALLMEAQARTRALAGR